MKVLVVDPDKAIAETVRRTVAAQGWTAAVADNGIDGYAEACAGDFDDVVLDIMMPGRNGYEVVRDLRVVGRGLPGGDLRPGGVPVGDEV